MQRSKVHSSTVRSVGYNPDTNMLELEFTSKEVYQYMNVPYTHYVGLMNAASHGSYFNNYIKDQYNFKKISRS